MKHLFEYSKASTQINLEDTRFYNLHSSLPKEICTEEHFEHTYQPHVTVCYGLENIHKDIIKNIIQNFPSFSLLVHGYGRYFQKEHSYVLYLPVSSLKLHQLHEKIRFITGIIPNYEQYTPHVTLGFLQKKIENYSIPFSQLKFHIHSIQFSQTDEEIFHFSLKG